MPSWSGNAAIDWLIISAAALTALGVVWRGAVRPSWRSLHRGWVQLQHAVDIGSTLVSIGDEFKINGGKSLRDAMDRTEVMATSTNETLKEHLLHADVRDAKIAALATNFNVHVATDTESFAEVKGAIKTVQGALDQLTELVAEKVDKARSTTDGAVPTA